MNFLSHYYFNRYSRDPELILGCVLPDLLKNADKDARIRPEAHELAFSHNPRLQQIYSGWQQHVETDRVFHNLPFFYDQTHQLRVVLAPLLEGTPIRASFMSHIALELLLDHRLLVDQVLDERSFYECLEAAHRPTVEKFLQLCGIAETAVFFKFFDAFIRARYVGRYRDVDQVVHALLNICRRLWDFRLAEDQRLRIVDALQAYADALAEEYINVFDEIENFV